MLHLIYYTQDGRRPPVYLCGWTGPLMDGHSEVHIAWASDSLLRNGYVCSMCHTEWVGAVDSLERWVRE